MTVRVTAPKATNIKVQRENLSGKADPSIRQVAEVVGKLVAAHVWEAHGDLHYRLIHIDNIENGSR